MRSIRRGDVRISHRAAGPEPQSMVFLHGLARHAGEGDRTARALQPGFTTIALDQRGHEASTREPSDISRAAFVDDLVAVLEDAACLRPVTTGAVPGNPHVRKVPDRTRAIWSGRVEWHAGKP